MLLMDMVKVLGASLITSDPSSMVRVVELIELATLLSMELVVMMVDGETISISAGNTISILP